MSSILIFDQAEYPGGSIARAVDLAMTMPQHQFFFVTYHPLSHLYHRTPSENICSIRLYSFYNYQKKHTHTEIVKKITKNKVLRWLGEKSIAMVDWLNECSLTIQLRKCLTQTPIDIVQANAGIHFLPYRLAILKKASLIYYFRHLDDYRWAPDHMLQYASHYIFVGKNLMDRHRLLLEIPDNKCRVIYSPFDSNLRLRETRPGDLDFIETLHRERRFIVLMAARICEEKGQDIALEAINILHVKYPQIILLLAGDEDTHYANYLHKKINQLQLNQHIYFIGQRTDIPHLLMHVDLALQAPLWFEALSGSLVEAMQLGVLTISADIGGASEVIRHNETGFLFTPGDSNELACLIEAILQNKQDFQAIREAGKAYTNTHWNPQNIHNAMLDVYAQALGNFLLNRDEHV